MLAAMFCNPRHRRLLSAGQLLECSDPPPAPTLSHQAAGLDAGAAAARARQTETHLLCSPQIRVAGDPRPGAAALKIPQPPRSSKIVASAPSAAPPRTTVREAALLTDAPQNLPPAAPTAPRRAASAGPRQTSPAAGVAQCRAGGHTQLPPARCLPKRRQRHSRAGWAVGAAGRY